MIDQDGFRENVGLIVCNHKKQVLWAKRIGQSAWQFPQGGVNEGETPEQAMYRELWEEVGLREQDVNILGCTQGWLKYNLPKHCIRHYQKPVCIGQKQKWFLLQLSSLSCPVRFDKGDKAEFDAWRWVDYWFPVKDIVAFKRDVYEKSMKELAPLLENG